MRPVRMIYYTQGSGSSNVYIYVYHAGYMDVRSYTLSK